MKTRRVIYIIFGSVLITLNLLVDLVYFSEYEPEDKSIAYKIGSIIGGHIFLIAGLIFLRLAYSVHKKIKRKEEDSLEEAVNSIGENHE
ncbi:MAG: hypothetical protein WBP16_15870 [Ferruginibacter sp.]